MSTPNLSVLVALALLTSAQAQFVQQGGKLVGSGLILSSGPEADAVAVSADGNTAVVNGMWDNKGTGSVWVFARSRGAWTQQGNKLEGAGSVGRSSPLQGYSVAISGDGNTILVGGPGDSGGIGAAWVFTRSGGIWNQQGPKLTDGGSQQGAAVALSADGNTALIGAPGGNGGALVYTRGAGGWTRQAALAGSGATGQSQQGFSVALSADGNTAIVGGLKDNDSAGAVWVFTRTGGAWSQQGKKLVGAGAAGQAMQGTAIAISADGNTVISGGPGDARNIGAFWVFTRSNGAWTQQGGKLVATGSSGGFVRVGQSVALSSDGNTALAGSPTDENGVGGAWLFKRAAGVWKQNGKKMVGSGAVGDAEQGIAVALSGEGTALLAGPGDNHGTGAVWVFSAPRDPLMYEPVTGTSYKALSNGDGTFDCVYNLFTPGFDVLRSGNFSGNGKAADVVLYNSRTGLGYIGVGNLDGTYDFNSLFWTPGYDNVESGDLNADMLTDFVLYNSSTGAIAAAISDSAGGFNYQYASVDAGYTLVRLADFNGDGVGDLFLYNRQTGAASIGIGAGDGTFAFYPARFTPGYDLADAGDLNGDGKADLFLYNQANGEAVTALSDGAGGFTFAPLYLDPAFTSVRLLDYLGNGNAAVILYNGTTGIASLGAPTQSGAFDFTSQYWGPGYDILYTEDVNVDGKMDLVLYNSATGTSYTGVSDGASGFAYTYSYWGPGKVFAK